MTFKVFHCKFATPTCPQYAPKPNIRGKPQQMDIKELDQKTES